MGTVLTGARVTARAADREKWAPKQALCGAAVRSATKTKGKMKEKVKGREFGMRPFLLLGAMQFGAPLWGQPTLLLVSQKAASSLGFYTWEGKHLGSVPVGKHPHEMRISADGRYAYTTDNGTMKIEQAGEGGNTVSVVDLKQRKRVAQISLGKYHRPHGMDLNPVTGELLVTSENPDQLIVIDLKKKKIIRTYDTGGRTPHIVVCGPQGKWAYVSNARSGTVAAIELATGKRVLIPAGGRPEGSVLSRDGTRLYVSNRNSSEITVIDTVAKKSVASIKTCKGPVRVGLAENDRTLIYACIGDRQMGFADVASRKQTHLVALDGAPVSLHTSPDGRFAFAGAQEQDTVYVVSIADRKMFRRFKTAAGAGPDPVQRIRAW